jgi:hypothetical protein
MMNIQKKLKKVFLENLDVKFLMLGMFFNPFGFDIIQYQLLLLTGSIWYANIILYCISGLCFGLYFYFQKRSKKK